MYKGKDQIAKKQLFRPEGRQLSDMQQFVFIIVNSREILYKGKDQIAKKQLWRPEGRKLSDMHQFVFIIVDSILPDLSSCFPFGLQTGFSSFSELAKPSPV